MRFQCLLPLAALTTAIVLPDEHVFNDLAVQKGRHKATILDQIYATKDKAVGYLKETFARESSAILETFENLVSSYEEDDSNDLRVSSFEDYSVAASAWSRATAEEIIHSEDEEHHHPHHPPPPPHHGDGPPHHGPPGRGRRPHHPHHPPHHGKPNLTIYELISQSKYTTKLAKLIDEDKHLVKLLNSTKANFTVFAPTDYAFSKIPEDAPKPPKDVIKAVLLYHVAPGLYPAGRVLFEKTVPTLLDANETLGGPQRLAARVGLRGVTLNFYSRIVAVNIPATNGIIHGLDSILIPPPKASRIISHLPTEFSTLLYAVEKTKLAEGPHLNHTGGTFFAPSNDAFRKLGPRINGFLFSSAGEKYLKALLLYHIVLNETVYSNAFYNGTASTKVASFFSDSRKGGCHSKRVEAQNYPYVHFDLPTLLEGRHLAVDIGRYGPFVEIKINAFGRVTIADGVALDGVIQLPDRVLIPPKQLSEAGAADNAWSDDDLTLEEFKSRFEPHVMDDQYLVEQNLEL